MLDWKEKGCASPPDRKVAPKGGLRIYLVWGTGSSEWGSGFFSLEKPASVLDAELRFNIADWGNGVNLVSMFQLKPGFHYFVGPVAHAKYDLSRPRTQVFLEAPFVAKVERAGTFEILRHDVWVNQRAGRA